MEKYYKELIKDRFMPDGKTPKCSFCGSAMTNYTPKKGKFKGQLQKYEWICNCKDYPKDLVLSVG